MASWFLICNFVDLVLCFKFQEIIQWNQLWLNLVAVPTCTTDIGHDTGTDNNADTDTDTDSATVCSRQYQTDQDQEKEGSEEECKAGRYFSGRGYNLKYFQHLLFTLDDSEKIESENSSYHQVISYANKESGTCCPLCANPESSM